MCRDSAHFLGDCLELELGLHTRNRNILRVVSEHVGFHSSHTVVMTGGLIGLDDGTALSSIRLEPVERGIRVMK